MPFGSCSPQSCGEEGVVVKEAGVQAAHRWIVGGVDAVGGVGRSWGLVPAYEGDGGYPTTGGLENSVGEKSHPSDFAPHGEALLEEEMFIGTLSHARLMDAALLWVPSGAHALKPGWLPLLLCAIASEPTAWVIGSPLLMDCERPGGWVPPPDCCTSDVQLSKHHLGPLAVYMARDDQFYDYVMEYHSGKLFKPAPGHAKMPFYTALTAVQWFTYHESRQRKLLHRWVASDAINYWGAMRLSLDDARGVLSALLLYTSNTSLPAQGTCPLSPPLDHLETTLDELECSTDPRRCSARPLDGAATPPPIPAPRVARTPAQLAALNAALSTSAARRADGASRLLVAFAGGTSGRMVHNHVLSLQRLDMTNWLVVTEDEEACALWRKEYRWARAEVCAEAPEVDESSGRPLGGAARRSAALLLLLREGLTLLATSADSVYLRDPWPSITSALRNDDDVTYSLMVHSLSSDALSASCAAEDDDSAPEEACASAQVIFLRGRSNASLQLVQRMYAHMLRDGEGEYRAPPRYPKQQSLLNRALHSALVSAIADATSGRAPAEQASVEDSRPLRWKLLDPVKYPNSIISFRRPPQEAWQRLREDNQAVPSAIVLLSTAGLPNEHTKEYLLREWGLWRATTPAEDEVSTRRFLAYDVPAAVDSSLVRQRGALRAALMIAGLVKRTLVLPAFWSLAGEGGKQVPFSFLFDYRAFATHFPDHVEAAVASRLTNRVSLHIVLGDTPSNHDSTRSKIFQARSTHGAHEKQLKKWLKPYAERQVIWFEHMYHRFTKFDDAAEQAAFELRFRQGLRPAPELQDIVESVVAKLREGEGNFNCLQVASEDVSKNGHKVFAKAASTLPHDHPTLLSGLGLSTEARRHMQKYFTEPRYLSELLTAQTRPFFEDPEGRVTLAFELVDVMACARAERFAGNMRTAFAAHVCYERNSLLELQRLDSNLAQVAKQTLDMNAAADGEGIPSSGPECLDIYNRPPQKGRLVL
ncbi:hypothetical protein AB1Y20_022317 [Prymnesium parvum]|uniref:Nucleotide-diphospho-sugar transferase domain-containing protein n=1 Tax=Prymnesium parvum TaxID=97485 RepID=A0AB34JH59_PRYPA